MGKSAGKVAATIGAISTALIGVVGAAGERVVAQAQNPGGGQMRLRLAGRVALLRVVVAFVGLLKSMRSTRERPAPPRRGALATTRQLGGHGRRLRCVLFPVCRRRALFVI